MLTLVLKYLVKVYKLYKFFCLIKVLNCDVWMNEQHLCRYGMSLL